MPNAIRLLAIQELAVLKRGNLLESAKLHQIIDEVQADCPHTVVIAPRGVPFCKRCNKKC